MRGGTIAQDKMLHGVNPLVELIGQISRSNAKSKSSVKFIGQNRWSNLSVKFTGQIAGQIRRSNLSVKFLVQIAAHVTPDVTPVTRDVTEKHARNRIQSLALNVPA